LVYPFGDHTQKRVYEVFGVVGKRIISQVAQTYANQSKLPLWARLSRSNEYAAINKNEKHY
jgi:hypothetical protein